MALEKARKFGRQTPRYLVTGLLTVIPLWITLWLINFILKQLANVGMPTVRGIGRVLEPVLPTVGAVFMHPWFQFALSVLLVLTFLWALGWLATRVLGKQLISLLERLIRRIPLVDRIYGTASKVLGALQQEPGTVQRVVLIPFPSEQMKTVGFVTRVFNDHHTGDQLAAVYVPTTPNPTSGYMEIVPVQHLVSTDWSVDEAMSFIISGGTIAPERIHYARSADTVPDQP